MSVLVLGSVNTDLVIRGPHLPRPGETVLGGEFYQAAGGKGANQAVAAARLLAGEKRVVFLAAVGDDEFGRQSLERLGREQIDCSHIKVVSGVVSGVALILVDQRGENLISVASGANLHLTPDDVDAPPEKIIQGCRVLLASLESPLATVQRVLARGRKNGLITILNPAPAGETHQIRKLLPLVDVLTPNEHELAALAGLPVTDVASAAAAAGKLGTYGAGSVVVTLGKAGALVVERDKPPGFIPPLKVEAIDATAAGDCFSGALAAFLSEGKGLVDAAGLANIAAGLSVTRRGAQPSLPSRDEVEARSREQEQAGRN